MVPIGHTTPLRSGHVSYMMRRFGIEEFCQYVESYKITEFFLVPPITVSLTTSPLTQKYSLRSVMWAQIGEAPLASSSQQRLQSIINPEARTSSVWGMTECTCLGTMLYWPERDATGSIGRFLPNMEVKLVDGNAQNVREYGASGELCIRGPNVISGYFENHAANASSFQDGWFYTGDIAYCDGKTKKWYIVDRKKELIEVRGFQVVPPELEAVLLSHPQIIDAAIIGVSHRQRDQGEVPRAYIVRRPGKDGAALTEEDVRKFMAERLAKYKDLDGGIVFLQDIPKTASGKYLKKDPRVMAKEEMNHSTSKL